MTIGELAPFIGTWRTTGTTLSGDGDADGQLTASDIYEWFPGEQFILHHVEGQMGEHTVRALEIMRYDPETGRHLSTSIDNSGQYAAYELKLAGQRWQIHGKTERFDGSFSADFSVLEGEWFATSEDGSEREWMRIRLEKA